MDKFIFFFALLVGTLLEIGLFLEYFFQQRGIIGEIKYFPFYDWIFDGIMAIPCSILIIVFLLIKKTIKKEIKMSLIVQRTIISILILSTSEILQIWTSGTFDWKDIIAMAVGSMIGAGSIWILYKKSGIIS